MNTVERVRVKIDSQDEKYVHGKIWIDKNIDYNFTINKDGVPCQIGGHKNMTEYALEAHALYCQVYSEMCYRVRAQGIENAIEFIKWMYGG